MRQDEETPVFQFILFMNIIVLVRTCSLNDKYFDNSAVIDENVDIMTGEKLPSIWVANMDIIHWSLR